MSRDTDIKGSSFLAGRLLAKNTVLNLAGQVVPSLVALVAIPPLIRNLGIERFGVLSLIWIVVGYFSLLDLGLGRAVIKLVAEKLGAKQEGEIPSLVWTALAFMTLLGSVGAVLLFFLSPWLTQSVLSVPQDIQEETTTAFRVLAVSTPVITASLCLRGVLEAYQRFDMVNAVRIPSGIFTFLGPLIAASFSPSLVPITAVLVAGRIITGAVTLWQCLKSVPALRTMSMRTTELRTLVTFGGWITISNIISPILTYFDRFLIGTVVSMGAVAYYATPYDVVTKLWIIPGALAGVLFPAFSLALKEDSKRAVRIMEKGMNMLFLCVFPVTIVIVMYSYEGLRFWLGGEFAEGSNSVLKILAIGVYINCFTQIAYSLVQSAGRPDITAKVHMVELPLYLITLLWFTQNYGIQGAALAWVLRVVADTFFIFLFARAVVPKSSAMIRRTSLHMVLAVLSLVVGGTLISGSMLKISYLMLLATIYALVTWRLLLDRQGRESLVSMVFFNGIRK